MLDECYPLENASMRVAIITGLILTIIAWAGVSLAALKAGTDLAPVVTAVAAIPIFIAATAVTTGARSVPALSAAKDTPAHAMMVRIRPVIIATRIDAFSRG